MRKTVLAITVLAVLMTVRLTAQEGREPVMDSPSRGGPVLFLVYMSISMERGIKQVKTFVLENSPSGTYTQARNRYDGKKSKLEIVGTGTFVTEGTSIIFTPESGAPFRGTRTDRYISVGDEYFIIAEEPKVVSVPPPPLP